MDSVPKGSRPDFLSEYAEWWLRHRAADISKPRFIGFTRNALAEIESERPGFCASLRTAALRMLGDDATDRVRNAIAALAIVGLPTDVPTIRGAGTRFGGLTLRDARTAAFEIAHRSPPVSTSQKS